MAYGTFTQEYDHAYAATTRGQSVKLIHDQVWYKHVFMYWLEKNARSKNEDGGGLGGQFERRLEMDENTAATSFGRGATFAMADPEILTVATYQWAQLGIPLTRYWQDEMRNAGREKIVDQVEANIKNTTNSLRKKAATQLVAATPGSNEFYGLPYYVSTTPTSGTVAGIDRAVKTKWQNQRTDMSALHADASLDQKLFDMDVTITKWGNVDYIVMGTTAFSFYNDVTSDQKMITDQRMGDAQFQKLGWKGIPVVCDYDIAVNSIYMLDSSSWEYVKDNRAYFTWTKWKEIPNALDRVAQLIMRAQLVCTKPKANGVLDGLVA